MNGELLVIGAGPAGLEAAVTAAGYGLRVTVVDSQARPGGRLWAQTQRVPATEPRIGGLRHFELAKHLAAAVRDAGVEFLGSTTAWGLFAGPRVGIARGGNSAVVEVPQVLVATGGSEEPYPFPGWTLPAVMMAGAAQTLLNIHRFLPGRRVLVLGSGATGLATAVQLQAEGAEIVGILEPDSAVRAGPPEQEALAAAGLRVYTRHTVVAARGKDKVQQVVIAAVGSDGAPVNGSERTLEADLVLLGFGLVPLCELIRAAGGEITYAPGLDAFVPRCDRRLSTTLDGVLAAGTAVGARDISAILATGRIAGITAAEMAGRLSAAEAAARRAELWPMAAEVAAHLMGEG